MRVLGKHPSRPLLRSGYFHACFRAFSAALTVALMAAAAVIPLAAQKAEVLSQVKTVYVDSLGPGRRAVEMRQHLIRRLEKSHEIQVVREAAAADAVVKGTEQIWTTGEVSLSPRSNSITQPVYEGFLSVEVVGKEKQTLWSYLVTPSKFPWGGITDDLARQVVNKLLGDIKLGDMKGESPEGPASSQTTSANATLKGAGATFPAPLYQKWFELFEEAHAGVHLGYHAVGSGEGIRLLESGKIDFGASEMPLSDEAMADAKRHFLQIPVVLGAVVPIYNVRGLRQKINFTPEVLAGIYLGKIKNWNDARIRNANPGMSFPDGKIVVVHRNDASGTTFVWSGYLSKISPEWKTSVGSSVSVQWPVGAGADYNDGVAATVRKTPNSIGYVELIYAIQHELSFGAVQNTSGEFIRADIPSVTDAARAEDAPNRDLRASIIDAPGKSAYPIATYTWLLIPDSVADKDKKSALAELLRWILTSGQKSCAALGYSPLPPDVAKAGMDQIDRWMSENRMSENPAAR